MENKDLYKLGQSEEGSLVDIGQEIRIDLELEDNEELKNGTVFGEVLDTEGNPIEGVTIKITDTSYNPQYHAVTNLTGTYTIDNIKGGEQYFIFAVKEYYTLKQGVNFVMQAGQQVERNFTMTEFPQENNNLVAGDIIDNKGNKLEGATVLLLDNSGQEPVLLKRTHTNQYGQYAFFDIGQGIYLVESILSGYKLAETSFVLDGNEKVRNINLTMDDDPMTRMGTINGVIKDKNGVAVSGAFVILFTVEKDEEGKETLTPIRKTMTDNEGLYLFEQIPEGNYKIKANKLKS